MAQQINRDNTNGNQENIFWGFINMVSGFLKTVAEKTTKVVVEDPTDDVTYTIPAKAANDTFAMISDVKNRGIKNQPYYYPDWWEGVKIPISVKNGVAIYNYDVSENIDLSSYTPYYISPTGNNSNDGLTESTPKLTITSAITAGAELIYMMPGTYLRDTFFGSNYDTGGDDLVIIGIGEVNITNGQGGLSWVLSTNNTYRATRSSATNVVDFKFKDKYGFYKPLKQVASQALCEAEAGTYFTDNVGVWVHTADERVPDSNVLPMVSIQSSVLVNSGKIYYEDLNFYDFELRVYGNTNTSTLEVFMKNVNVPVVKRPPITATTEYNCFRFEGFRRVELQNCTGIESTQDVFNYHNASLVPNSDILEIECRAYNAGLKSVATNNQCSSAHENGTILRINGSYYGGNAQTIADVEGVQSILIGCELNTGSEQPNTTIFQGYDAELFGCKLYGDKTIVENGGTHGVKIYNSIVDYSSTSGNVIIE